MIKIEVSPTSILVPVQWEDARLLVDCRKISRQDAKAQRRTGKLGSRPTTKARKRLAGEEKTAAHTLRIRISLRLGVLA